MIIKLILKMHFLLFVTAERLRIDSYAQIQNFVRKKSSVTFGVKFGTLLKDNVRLPNVIITSPIGQQSIGYNKNLNSQVVWLALFTWSRYMKINGNVIITAEKYKEIHDLCEKPFHIKSYNGLRRIPFS